VKLHYYDPVGRRLGELKADEMLSVLSTAERASKTILGEAAKVLARLGRIEFELNSEAGLQLPDAIAKARDDLKNILGAYEPPEAIPVDDPAILEKLGTQERREAMKVREEKIEVVTEQLIQDGDTSLQAQKIEKLLAKWPLVMIKEMKIDKPMTDPLVGLLKRLKEDYPNLLRPSSEPPMRKDLAADVLGGRGGKTKSKPATGFSPIRSPLTQQIDPFATARQRLMGELSREDLMLLLADS
jgi:hypothetical protein